MTDPREPRVFSVSRRTDIPAFYMDWFMERIRRKNFESVNPYNGRVAVFPATPETVHTFVFWSKNFGPFLQGRYGERLSQKGFHQFFNFTVNSESPLLEPGVPSLKERLRQMKMLCQRFGPETVTWRFDPICWFATGKGTVEDNIGDFEEIAGHATAAGIRRCITSFMDFYPKIKSRIRKRGAFMSGFNFIDPPLEKKSVLLSKMEGILEQAGIRLSTCCEKAVLEAMPKDSRIEKASCIPNGLLMDLFGGSLSMKSDPGQRIRKGCGCRVSVDVGSYRLHPCFHGCLFCYANPA